MKLSKPQQAKFWKLFAEAVAENFPGGCDKSTKDAFRYKIIKESTDKDSLTIVGTGRDYERLMAATASMTENWEERLYWCMADERKYKHMIGVCLVQINHITGEQYAWDYVRGTLNQAHWPEDWQDISADMLHSVFKMLDTHRRRLLRRANWQGSRHDQPIGFNPQRTYYYHAGDLLYRDDLPVTAVGTTTQEVL